MRLKDREITDRNEIDAIIAEAKVCRLAMVDGDTPYIVPLNFGYQDNTVYIHSATEGRKLDILKSNPNVCMEFDMVDEIVLTDIPCECTTKYRSVIAFGKASLVEDGAEKREALSIILSHYTELLPQFYGNSLDNTTVIKVDIGSITGKQS